MGKLTQVQFETGLIRDLCVGPENSVVICFVQLVLVLNIVVQLMITLLSKVSVAPAKKLLTHVLALVSSAVPIIIV